MKKLRRSMLFIPGSSAAMLSTAFIYKPDSIMFDLEDAVALKEKDSARLLVFHALQHLMYNDIETVVRINPLNTPFGLRILKRRQGWGGCYSSAENRLTGRYLSA
jgi:citrate lyase subunit beta/citryl-CoA lyase